MLAAIATGDLSPNSCSQSQSPRLSSIPYIGSCIFSEHASRYTAKWSTPTSSCDCHHEKLSDPALGSGRCPGTGWVCARMTTKMTTTIPNPLALTQATPSRHRLRGSTCSTGEISDVHASVSRGNWRGCLVMCLGVRDSSEYCLEVV